MELDPVDKCILDTHLRHLECINCEIGFLDSRIAGKALESVDALLLMTLTGVYYHSATMLAARARELYLRVSSRKGTGKAAVRVANKMAAIIWYMLTERKPYMQVKERLCRSKLKKMKRLTS